MERVNDDRLYRALDRLLPHKQALEQHLRRRLGELFALEYDLLLYDVTSTYFEGLAERNPLAQRGYSRDHRPDCKQVCIALVVTREGMPVGYEVFAGNRTDVTTVEEIVEQMEAALRAGPAHLGDGSWHDQRREPRVVAADRAALPDRHGQKRAAQVGARDRRRPRLAERARRSGGQALRRTRRQGDLRVVPLGGTPREGAGDACALCPAHRAGPG